LEFPASFLGLCYDSGHGNFRPRLSLDKLESFKARLIAVHLHDNDGTDDQHRVPFHGSVDWPRVTAIIARSSYKKCLSLESSMKTHGDWSRKQFLHEAFLAGRKLTSMMNGTVRGST
jgi:sugar phosphate isomerase/epimerase